MSIESHFQGPGPAGRGRAVAVVVALALPLFSPAPSQAEQSDPDPTDAVGVKAQLDGGVDVSISYPRLRSGKGQLWGEQVPYGSLWAGGGQQPPSITFGGDVYLLGNRLNAGTYTLLAIPQESTFEIRLQRAEEHWGEFAYDESMESARLSVATETSPDRMQDLSFAVVDDQLVLTWDDVSVPMWVTAATLALWHCGNHDPSHGARTNPQRQQLEKVQGCSGWKSAGN